MGIQYPVASSWSDVGPNTSQNSSRGHWVFKSGGTRHKPPVRLLNSDDDGGPDGMFSPAPPTWSNFSTFATPTHQTLYSGPSENVRPYS